MTVVTVWAWIRGAGVAGWCLAASAHAAPAFDPDGPHMLGDWGGLRSRLEQRGVAFDLAYTSESAVNIDGGYDADRTAKYSDQWSAGVNFDFQKLVGLPGADFHFLVTKRSGNDLTPDRLVDPATGTVSSVQEVHGRGNVFRLTQLWYGQRLFGEAVGVKLGRLPVGDDFASFTSDFQNLYLGSGEPGNQNGDIWRNSPVSQWGAVAKWNVTPAAYASVGVYQLNEKDLDDDTALDPYHAQGNDGQLIPVELGWKPRLGPAGLPGDYKIGGYLSTASAIDYRDADEGATKGDRVGLYFVVDQQVTARGGDASRGLSVFSLGGWNDESTAFVDRYLAAGITYKGPLDARPKDDAGLGLAYAHVGDDYDSYFTDGPGAAAGFKPSQSVELDAEVYYGFHLAEWLQVRPNLQYVANPGANSDVEDAWVGGLMVKAKF